MLLFIAFFLLLYPVCKLQKRRVIHWEKLDNKQRGVAGTIFADLKPQSVHLPIDKLRAEFEEKPAAEAAAAAAIAARDAAAADGSRASKKGGKVGWLHSACLHFSDG